MDPVVHFELPFDDKEKIKQFYKKVFGWEFQDMEEMNYTIARGAEVDENFMLKEPGRINGGMYQRDEKSAPGAVIVINVSSVDEYVTKVKEAGGSIFREKMEVGDMGFYAQIKDTEGNIVGIWEDKKKE